MVLHAPLSSFTSSLRLEHSQTGKIDFREKGGNRCQTLMSYQHLRCASVLLGTSDTLLFQAEHYQYLVQTLK